MWTLISRINLAATRRRVARRVVATAVVLGSGTQMAMALLPHPASDEADTRRVTTSNAIELPASAGVSIG